MRSMMAMISVSLAASATSAAGQTVIQQNSVSVGEGSSVTVSGQTVTVETRTNAGRVVGDGQPASETHRIVPVSAISVDGAFAVTVALGPVPGLRIETDKNLLPIVDTEVMGDRLTIRAKRSYSVDGRIRVWVTTPKLAEITASGSNEIDGAGLSGVQLSLSLSGSNGARLAGEVGTLDVQMSGSNRLAARGLTADAVIASIDGSGNAVVTAHHRIAAHISGVGTISVYGNPRERSTEVNGAGRIAFVE
jgi:Putative auto-transporter adhesin, head GIN domain